MDENDKISRYYDHDKLVHYVKLMEQFASMANSENATEKQKKAYNCLVSHYRRMCISCVTKDFPKGFKTAETLTSDEVMDILNAYTA